MGQTCLWRDKKNRTQGKRSGCKEIGQEERFGSNFPSVSPTYIFNLHSC